MLRIGLLLLLIATPGLPQLKVAGVVSSTTGGLKFPDGTVQTSAAGAYRNVVTVAASGADFTSIQAALDAIFDADDANRYLVSVSPGVFNETVTMKPFVDIQGSGEQSTQITSAGSSAPSTATLLCADDSELRDLTVISSGGDDYSIAILCDATSPSLERVTASSSFALLGARAIELVNGASARLSNVTASATGFISGAAVGISMTSASPTLVDVNASASATNRYLIRVGPGIYTEKVTMEPYVDIEGAGMEATKVTWAGSSLQSDGTILCADSAELRSLTVENSGGGNFATAVACDGSASTLRHIRTEASGGLLNSTGIYIASASPTLIDVAASATGGISAYGIDVNLIASPRMNRVVASASGATTNVGVRFGGNSHPVLTDSEISASGGNNNYGVRGVSGTSTLTRSVVTATGGISAYAIFNINASSSTVRQTVLAASGASAINSGIYHDLVSGSPTSTVEHSQIHGVTATIRTETGATVLVATSQLDGGAVDDSAGGTVTCAGVWDESFTFSGATCP